MPFQDAVMWTAKSLREALAALPDDTRILFDGCSCCTKSDGEGIQRIPGPSRASAVVIYRNQKAADYGFDDERPRGEEV